MPHVSIKHFPRDFTGADKTRLAEAVTQVVLDHFDTYPGAVSIAVESVPAADWQETVFVPDIEGRRELLIKQPRYRS